MTPIANDGPDSFSHDLAALFDAFQEERVRLLGSVRELQLASQLLGNLEAQRLAAKNGVDEGSAAALVARGTDILQRVDVLDVEIQVASITVPAVTGNQTLVHGRVTDTSRMAARGATAVLVDDRGKPVDGVGPVEIDESGYYAFVLSADVAKKIGKERMLSVAVERDEVQIAPADAPHFTIEPGTVKVADVALDANEMKHLKLVPTFTPRTARKNPRKGSGRGRKRGRNTTRTR